MQERTLSSTWTFWAKFLFPAIWILAFGYVTFFWSGGPSQTRFVFLIVWIAGTASILWAHAGLKRVRMDERQLYMSNYFREIDVPFSAITNVKQNRWINSRPITIYFRDATQFGREKPDIYIRVVASILPKVLDVALSISASFEGLQEDAANFAAAYRLARSMIGATPLIEQEPVEVINE